MSEPADPLPRQRIWLVYSVMTLFLAGSLADLVTGREHWPFSPYPMYAVVPRGHSLVALRLFGVTAGTAKRAQRACERRGREMRGGREIPLVAPESIRPFTPSRLEGALRELKRRGDPSLIREALGDCLRRYEKRRRAGDHHGSPLQSIRLYRVSWKLDPWARNVDRPDRKELILEVMPP